MIHTAGEYGIVKEPEIKFTDKGKAWLKLRVKSSERVRDSDGKWVDGNVTYIDVLVFDKPAQHLYDSVVKGDSIVVVGKLGQREWTDKEGNKRIDMQIMADHVGVSTRWGPAKTGNVGSVSNAIEGLQATEVPF